MSTLAIWRLNEPPLHPRESVSLSLGIKRFGSGWYDRAYRNIRKTLSLNPSNSKARELEKFLRIVDVPKYAESLEDPEEQFEQLIQSFPESPYLKMVGAELLLSNNNPTEANSLLLRALSEYPNIPHNWYVLGLAQRELGEKEKAIISITKAIDLDPQQRYFAALGDCHFFSGEWELALKNYKTTFKGKKFELSSKIGYLRSLIYTGEFNEAVVFGTELLNTVSKSARLPKKNRNKARLIVSLSHYQVVTDLTRLQTIEYIKTLLSVAGKLIYNEDVNFSEILRSSDLSIRPAIKFDISQFLQAGN